MFGFDLDQLISFGRVCCFGSGGSSSVSETADMVEQAKINAELWDYYESTYKPQIDSYIARTTDEATTEAEGRQVAGQIRGELMKNVNPEAASTNPVENAKRLSKLGTLESKAQTEGAASVREHKIGELQNIIDIGRGEETTAQTGLSALAGQSVESAISDAETEATERAATENAIGSAIGMAGALSLRQMTVGKNKKSTIELP